jgi:pantoate--beta-alanine ligase
VLASQALRRDAPVELVLQQATQSLLDAGFDSVDYFALCDAASLERLARLDRPARLLVAAKIGRTRLIDNIAVNP